MKEFEICYTEHELKWVSVEAKNEKDARRKFESGDIDWDAARGYGDYGDPTINEITPIDEKTGLPVVKGDS